MVNRDSHQPALKVGVATVGLIGGSIALRAQQAGAKVMVWHHNDSPKQWAQEHGFDFSGSLQTLCEWQPDILIVASPLNAMTGILAQIAEHVLPETTVTDAGSVKEKVLEAALAAGIGSQYVGAHPMAGNEKSGFASARSELLEGATWAVTVTDTSDQQRVLAALDFAVNTMGARVLVTDPITHDNSVSLISHLPHVLAHALTATTAQSSAMELALALAAGSFRDVTRVARENPDRNLAMITSNHRAVLDAVSVAEQFLADIRSNLEQMIARPQDSVEKLSTAFHAGDRAVEHYRVIHDDDVASGGLSTAESTAEDIHIEVPRLGARLVELCSTGSVVAGVHRKTEDLETVTVTLA